MLDKMKATDGTKTYFFLSQKDTYTGLETDTGVTVAATTDADEPVYKVDQLQGKGILFRLTCYLDDDSVREVLCVRSKLGTALETLDSKSIEGVPINSVTISRKARFS